jgi:DNA-binding PadR family transcriptional regulator
MTTRLIVLGLLASAPMHGYEMQRIMETSRVDAWAGILPGSLYHALRRMSDEGLVTVQAIEASGHRQRAVYAITPAGRRAFADELRASWATEARPFPVPLYMAMTFLDGLPPAEVLALVEARTATLGRQLADWDTAPKEKPGASIGTRLAMENLRRHLALDLEMLVALREALVR